MSEPRTPQFEILLQGYLEGALNASESDKLLTMLKENPALGKVILDELALSDVLKTVVGDQDLRAAATSASQRRSKISSITNAVKRRPTSKHRRGTSSWWTALGLAAAIVLVATFGISNGWFSKHDPESNPLGSNAPEIASISLSEGGARLISENSPGGVALASGAKLHSGDRIQTNDGGITLEYPDGTHIEIEADSEVLLLEEAGAKRVRLDQGELSASIAKQPAGKPMLFSTSQASAVVLGTKLVLAFADNSSRLDVTEGAVHFETDAAHGVEVKQGFSALTRSGGSIALTPLTEPLPWKRAPFANRVAIERLEERTPKGRPVLKLSYEHHDIADNKKEYCMMSQPLAPAATSHSIRVAYFVLSATPNARINAVLTTKDHGSWFINEQNLSRVAPNTWHEFVVPLDKSQKKQNTVGAAMFDKASISHISISIWGGKAVLLLGDSNVSD